MIIKIGKNTFSTTLYKNETTKALKAQLPLVLYMIELHSNEKYAQLPTPLPTNTEAVRTIHIGDIMLWETNTLVIFYKTFETTYQYTQIGHIDNPRHLVQALGKGNVTISFYEE
ncbi:MAG: cyclophilin-like fold protein [Chitinophagaceae bacterium]|nr:cyclophilin-like fold protein [Chitinophagaceae bacterium]